MRYSQFSAAVFRTHRSRFARAGFVLLSLLFSGLSLAETDILIVQSHDSPPYRLTLAGLEADLANSSLNAAYHTLALADANDTETLNRSLQNAHPKLILTMGTPATHALVARDNKTPIVACLVLDTGELRQTPNATGVGLSFPPAVQWTWLRRVLPDARQIAVLYDPKQGTALFQLLQKQAQSEGIELIQAPAANAEDVPTVMHNLPPQLDALWAVDGASAFSAATVRELLLYSFRNRVPLIGLSEQWVKAGALYALDWDYSDLGMQTAGLIKEILVKGVAPISLSPLAPRKVRVVLNSKTAEHMKLQIAERWLSEITEVQP